ncbi:tetratricopeptide repeat protein [uncultured Phocaeicola sp.]|uniref:tetratricopeptide repeat protein n=1 Tax=uncultured Phocaeicola sp. TaxID=990718 RepID=UPI0030C66B29
MNTKKYKWIAGCLCALPLVVSAQQTEPLTDHRRLFDDGKELFLRHDYAAAQQTLMQYVKQNPQADTSDEVAYMLTCTAYELNASDRLEQLEKFLDTYPDSRHRNRVQALLASAYFFQEKYLETIATFKGCDLELLSNEERDVCTLRMATAYQKIGNLQEASMWFSILKEVSEKYHADAVYNLAYIDYVQKRYDEALAGFREVESDEHYRKLSPYYIADIYLIKGNYEQARRIAGVYVEAYPDEPNAVQMKRIAGEVAYGMKDYMQAVQNLEVYCSEVKNPDRKALYELGMSYAQIGVYSKAAARLGEVTTTQDALTQNAYLHMGLAYLQLKERNQARMAFEQASATNYDAAVKEQALYNYALCIHETSYSPFAESVTVFERFLNEYPHSAYADKVNDYLVEVYMNTRSYMAALKSIAKISQPGERILEAKQKLLFRLGTQAFAQAAFENAIECFSQSLQLGRYNQQTKADAYYWRGESKYRLEQYAAAAADFRQYLEFTQDKRTEEYGLALYNLGYTAFKQKQYSSAQTWFARCVQSGVSLQATVMADAYNRLGDCNFYARSFETAQQMYAKAAATDTSLGDYSLFQEAFVKGLQRNYTGKIQTLNQMITAYPSSQYLDDALYEQGRAFVQLEDSENAVKRYKLLVERFPDSPLSRKAANEIGLLYYQNDQYAAAIEAYKTVITKYPGSDEARLAQRDLRSIYIDLNKVDDYMAFATSIPGGANFDVNERDSLTYVAAERVYMRGNISEAQSSFTRYLQSFPEGAFSVDAHYYLGLIGYNQKNWTEATAHLNKVIEYPNNKFSGEAMSMCAVMAYDAKDYGRALELYKRMIDRAVSQEERLSAETGALRSAYLLNDGKEVIAVASALLAESKLAPELSNEAHYYRAKAFLEAGETKEALQDLTVLAKDTRNVYGAEAKYLVAQLYFNAGETAKAEKEVLEYIEVSTPHTYWLARGFILLSDVYVRLDRKLEAKQYLLSLQQNYQAEDDIAQMIESRLANLNKGE